MARYFFDLVECGDLTPDEEGVELADIDAARRNAIAAARDVMCAEVREGRLCLACAVSVRTSDGRAFEMPFREAVRVSGL